MVLKVKKLIPEAKSPVRRTEGSVGYDLFTPMAFSIPPESKYLVPLGIVMAIPENVEGKIESRSGLALKKDIRVEAGVIDWDYRGEVGVLLRNLSKENTAHFEAGDSIAQLTLLPVITTKVEEVEELDETERGSGGFGSTDTKKTSPVRDASPTRAQIN